MSVDYNNMTDADVANAFLGPTWCFPATKSDTNYITDPNDASVPLVAAAISLSAVGAVKLELWNERIVTIPSGVLIPGVRYLIPAVKIYSTGTDAGVSVLIWRGDSLLALKKTPEPVSATISSGGSSFSTSADLAALLSDETGTGVFVLNVSPTLVTPVLGTPSSGTLTNCTGLPVSTGISGLGTGVATFLATPSSANLRSAVSDGGTGTGAIVCATSPTLTTPLVSGTLSSNTANKGYIDLNAGSGTYAGLGWNGTVVLQVSASTFNAAVGTFRLGEPNYVFFKNAASGVLSVEGSGSAGGTARWIAKTASQITADQNNYNPGGNSYFQRWNSDASRSVTGLLFSPTQVDGEKHEIHNVGSNNIVLVNESASSTATNRFHNSTGADITLSADQAVDVIYDNTTQRWRVHKRN